MMNHPYRPGAVCVKSFSRPVMTLYLSDFRGQYRFVFPGFLRIRELKANAGSVHSFVDFYKPAVYHKTDRGNLIAICGQHVEPVSVTAE
jgi:hypothetical protein